MGRPRFLAPDHHPSAVYHCISRVVDRRLIFGDSEKDLFRSLLAELAAFCQVRVLTFCIMSNHFHILVEVPKPPDPLPSAEDTLDALSQLSGCQDVPAARQLLQTLRKSGDPNAETQWLARFHARRWNLSTFMKLLKQRFSTIYNRRNRRKGTLWEERFRSVLVEGDGPALGTMAAYIDLNPVRAGMVKDPKAYRWSGYAEAMAGKAGARAGLQRIARALLRRESVGEEEAVAAYRRHVYAEGSEEGESTGPDGRPVRGALKREAVLAVLEQRGRVPVGEYLRCRVRYFCDGGVFGSREFVEDIFRSCRNRFGPRRKTGARPMRGVREGGLYTMRALRIEDFG